MSPPDRLQQMLAAQDGVVSYGQLRASGVTRAWWRAQIDARRWQALNGIVLCTHNGPLTQRQAAQALVLSAPGAAALCGLTGLQLWGVTGFPHPLIHVLIARGARIVPVKGVMVAVHESRRFSPDDIVTGRVPAMTSLERSAIDAAVWSPDSRTATRIVIAAVQQRHTTAPRLRDELAAAGRVRHRRLLDALLADVAGGAEALSEVAMLRWCRKHGFPAPRMQVRLDRGGRRRYIDAVFERSDGRRILVEVDGGVHLTLTARWNDTAKDNDAVLAGELALRFPSVAIYSNDPVAVAQLRAALTVVSATGGPGHP